MGQSENPRGWKFELRRRYPSGTHNTNFTNEAEAHAELGRFAGEHGLSLHIHKGGWSEAAYSVAYDGLDPLLGARAVVTLYQG